MLIKQTSWTLLQDIICRFFLCFLTGLWKDKQHVNFEYAHIQYDPQQNKVPRGRR